MHNRNLPHIDALLMSVSEQLDTAMREVRLSQAKLARLAETSPVTVNRALRCADLQLSTLSRLAEAAGCTVKVTFVRDSTTP